MGVRGSRKGAGATAVSLSLQPPMPTHASNSSSVSIAHVMDPKSHAEKQLELWRSAYLKDSSEMERLLREAIKSGERSEEEIAEARDQLTAVKKRMEKVYNYGIKLVKRSFERKTRDLPGVKSPIIKPLFPAKKNPPIQELRISKRQSIPSTRFDPR